MISRLSPQDVDVRPRRGARRAAARSRDGRAGRAAVPTVTPAPRWREVLAAPAVALVTLAVAIAAAAGTGIRFRDPDHVAAQYVLLMIVGVALLVGLDVAVRAGRATGTWRPSRAALSAVRRRRWTWQRMASSATALLSFYTAYLAYRNLKGLLPWLRPGDLFDDQLARVDRWLLGGHDPATVLHQLLGTGFMTQVLSTVYVAFIVFLPLSLAVALVFSPGLSTSLFFATALSANWLLGIGSYVLLPSLGPAYADPGLFAALPHSEVTHLQAMLMDDRVGFLHDPARGTPQAIAAFASLHIAMSFTALATAYLLGLRRRLKVALWVWLVLTFLATIYLGWHYVVDDLAGVLIGAVSLGLARVLTDYDVRAARALA